MEGEVEGRVVGSAGLEEGREEVWGYWEWRIDHSRGEGRRWGSFDLWWVGRKGGGHCEGLRKVGGYLICWIEEEEAGQGVVDFDVGGLKRGRGWMIGWVGRRRRIGM